MYSHFLAPFRPSHPDPRKPITISTVPSLSLSLPFSSCHRPHRPHRLHSVIFIGHAMGATFVAIACRVVLSMRPPSH